MRIEIFFIKRGEGVFNAHGYIEMLGAPLLERTWAMSWQNAVDIANEIARRNDWEVITIKIAGNYKL